MVKCIQQILDKSNPVLNNPVNLCRTKVNKSKLVLNNPANSCRKKMNAKCMKIYINLPNHLFRDMHCYNIMKCTKQILDKSELV